MSKHITLVAMVGAILPFVTGQDSLSVNLWGIDCYVPVYAPGGQCVPRRQNSAPGHVFGGDGPGGASGSAPPRYES